MQEFAQAGPTAMQVRFDGTDAATGDVADLVERVAKNILEDDTATQRCGKAHECTEARRCRLATLHLAYGVRNHAGILVREDRVLSGAARQEIEGAVVGNTKKPALQMRDRHHPRRRVDRLHRNLLDQVLPVDYGTGHPRAVPVQPRSQLDQRAVKHRARLVSVLHRVQSAPPSGYSAAFATDTNRSKYCGMVSYPMSG